MYIYQAKNFIPQGSSVGLFETINGKDVIEHSHDFIEIVFVTGGTAEQKVNGNEYKVSRGDVVFINYKATHSFVSCKDFCYVNVCFMPELLKEKITEENALALLAFTQFDELCKNNDGNMIKFSVREQESVEFILREMLIEKNKSDSASNRIIESYFNVLIEKMLRKMNFSVVDEEEKDCLALLVEHINKNLSERLTLSELAKKSFYNPSYLSRAFKNRYGVTITDYVAKKRVEKSIGFLKEGLSVDKICEIVGFSDRSAFYSAFEKHNGSDPKEFRIKK